MDVNTVLGQKKENNKAIVLLTTYNTVHPSSVYILNPQEIIIATFKYAAILYTK